MIKGGWQRGRVGEVGGGRCSPPAGSGRVSSRTLCTTFIDPVRILIVISGMTSRDFKGIPSLQEVECSGGSLKPELKLLSLKIYTTRKNVVLGSLNVITNTCLTYGDFSSCYVNGTNTHRSRLRVLVPDLDEGESREYGCRVSAINSEGDTKVSTWSIFVTRRSECGICTGVLSLFSSSSSSSS